MSNEEYLEINHKLNQVLALVEILTPAQFSLSSIATMCKANRKTIYKYLTSNYIENRDFYKEGGKILVSQDVGIELIRRYRS